MYITDSIQLVKNNKNYVKALTNKNVKNPFKDCSQDELKIIYEKLYDVAPKERFSLLYGIIDEVKKDSDSTAKKPSITDFKKLMSKFIDFFVDFNFAPSIRFMNTLAQTYDPQYVSNYFAIMNSPYLEDIQSKIKSPEFDKLLSGMKEIPVTKKINNRFDLYYGSQGTGKTTAALRESDGRCISCGVGEKILKSHNAYIACCGGNNLDREIYSIYRKLQKPETNVFNIVLFDGDAYSNCSYGDFMGGFGAFNHENCVIISDIDNVAYISKQVKKARVIYCKDYCKELNKEMINAMRLALSR